MARSKRLPRERCAICNRWIELGEERNYMGSDDEWFAIHIECLEVPDDAYEPSPSDQLANPS